MDTHLFLKIIHMSSATLALIVFVLRGLTLFIGTQGNQPNPIGRKILVALQHLSFSLIILTGIILLVMNQFMVQPWFYAKIHEGFSQGRFYVISTASSRFGHWFICFYCHYFTRDH